MATKRKLRSGRRRRSRHGLHVGRDERDKTAKQRVAAPRRPARGGESDKDMSGDA